MGKGFVCGWNLYVSYKTKGRCGIDQIKLRDVAFQWKSLTEAERQYWDEKAQSKGGSLEETMRSHKIPLSPSKGGSLGGIMRSPKKRPCGWNLFVGVQTKGKHGADKPSMKDVALQWKSLTKAERQQWENPCSPIPSSYSECDEGLPKKRPCGWNLFVGVQTKGKHGADKPSMKDVVIQWKSLDKEDRQYWDEIARRRPLSQLEGGGIGGTHGSPKKRPCGWNLFVGAKTKGKHGADKPSMKDVVTQWKSLTAIERHQWGNLGSPIPPS